MKVITNIRDAFISVECGRACIEIEQDGDSPAFPDSWSWGFWHDGDPVDVTYDDMSLKDAVSKAVKSAMAMAREIETVASELADRYGVEMDEPSERCDFHQIGDFENEWQCTACGEVFESDVAPTWMQFCPMCGCEVAE